MYINITATESINIYVTPKFMAATRLHGVGVWGMELSKNGTDLLDKNRRELIGQPNRKALNGGCSYLV